MQTRIIVGALLIAGLLGLASADANVSTLRIGDATLGPGVILTLVSLFVFAPLLALEFSTIVTPRGDARHPLLHWIAIAGGMVVVLATAATPPLSNGAPAALTAPFVAACIAGILQVASRHNDGFARAGGSVLLGFALIGVPLGFWLLLRRDTDAWTLAAAILCVKAADIGAYFTGVAIGRNKMCPWLSPGKTWEGFAGGVLLSAMVGVAAGFASATDAAASAGIEAVQPLRAAWIAALLGIAGTLGDLLESLLKRGAGMKDSGRLLPGMGGLYDVFDSLLLAGPLAWWLLACKADFP